jgi:hypothetical protein
MEKTTWLTEDAGPFGTMVEGKAAAKSREERRWKWASSPGDGKKFAVFVCNAHKDCGRLVRVMLTDGNFWVQSKGDHAEERSDKKRSNSTLTFAEDVALRTAVDSGSRPAGHRVAMTKIKSTELKALGEDPLNHKLPDGGLKGEL